MLGRKISAEQDHHVIDSCVCMVISLFTTVAGVWINRVRLPILLSWLAELPFAPENLSSETGSAVPSRVVLLILHNLAESGCLLTGFLPISAAACIYLCKPSSAIGSVPSLSGRAIAYRWRSLPRVRRHRVSSPHVVPVTGAAFAGLTTDQ